MQDYINMATAADMVLWRGYGVMAKFDRNLNRKCNHSGLVAACGHNGGCRHKVNDRNMAWTNWCGLAASWL